jgi:hypothetical protein
MNPTDTDLIDMGLWGLNEQAKELLGKWDRMTPAQRREFREIALSVLTEQKQEAA